MNIIQAKELAQDETTSPDKLRELSDSNDTEVLKNIVANPNVPPDVLAKLASLFPKQVFNNPAIDLLLLETPELIYNALADYALCALLKREVPVQMIEYAANLADRKLQLSILTNPQTPSKIVDQLADSDCSEVSEAAIIHINYPHNINDDYKQLAKEKITNIIGSCDNYRQFKKNIERWEGANILFGELPNDLFIFVQYYAHLSEVDYSKLLYLTQK